MRNQRYNQSNTHEVSTEYQERVQAAWDSGEVARRAWQRTDRIADMAYDGLPTLINRFGSNRVLMTIRNIYVHQHGRISMKDVLGVLAPNRAARRELYEQMREDARQTGQAIDAATDFSKIAPEDQQRRQAKLEKAKRDWGRFASPMYSGSIAERVDRKVAYMEYRDAGLHWGMRYVIGPLVGIHSRRIEDAQNNPLERFASLMTQPGELERWNDEFTQSDGDFFRLVANEDRENQDLTANAQLQAFAASESL